MNAFFAMGGYAAYVWPAYGISLLGLAATVVMTLRSYRQAKALLAEVTSDEAR